jgi:predicted ATPase with chaperone activity
LIVQILMKTLNLAGEVTGAELARRLGVKFSVIEAVLEDVKNRRYVEICGGGLVGGSSYRMRLTDTGRTTAHSYFQHSRYVGPLPVTLQDYWRYSDQFTAATSAPIPRERIAQAFSHLILSDRMLEELCLSVNARHSVLIYGPPGNGKSVIARAICRLLSGEVAIPHALIVEGAIVRLFDLATHELLPSPEVNEGLGATVDYDARWARCRRPRIIAGGELTMQALELSYGANAGVYRAPIQMLANGGVLVIDDFGRERCPPKDLLDRWMVPLENHVDFLTLQSGLRIEVPFTPMIVFATNLRPSDLLEEAFLRRVRFKVYAANPNAPDFARIFEDRCHDRHVAFSPDLVEHLLNFWYRPRKLPLRACHPRDLINQALLLAEYRGEPGRLTPELLEKACEAYFVTEQGIEQDQLAVV